MPMRAPVLLTERLTLRPFKYGDLPEVFRLCQDPETSRYSLWEPHTSYLDSLRYIYWTKRKSQGMHWAVLLNEKLIGSCSYVKIDNDTKVGEIGYSILPSQWGNGFAREAAEAIIEYGFSVMGLNAVQVRIMLLNTRSLSVARKLGMKPGEDGEKFVLAKGVRREITLMELSCEDYFSEYSKSRVNTP